MKKIMKRGVSLCMAVALLLTATALAPPASAAGENSLENAEVMVRSICKYDGSAKTPSLKVTLRGKTLQKDVDYSVSFQNNIDAGIATAVITGTGDYYDSQTVEFNILPRKVLKKELTLVKCVKPYDGNVKAQPEISVEVLPGDVVEVTYTKAEFHDQYAGANKKVTVSGIGFAGPDGANYEIEDATIELEDYI